MEKKDPRYQAYIQILKEELIPAMGCTEPIALAYAAAVARKTLGEMPDKVVVEASGSIIKNVKSVIVPNTGHLKGINAAAAAGIVAGDPDKQLEVIATVSQEQIRQMKQFMEEVPIQVVHMEDGCTFDIIVTVFSGKSYAKVRIANFHTNIVLIEKKRLWLNLTLRKLADFPAQLLMFLCRCKQHMLSSFSFLVLIMHLSLPP